ncbi:GTP-binding protein [Geomonas sp.]|uniref:GTP-binding protein n=1 Tax=Geomonas sp. TaxID=2651584 RepID=UPI002B4A116D|nr:ADP-ribosylation factor-like protein [Geomonas sp.]HJV33829.1 ADP-ribosylation factor-like protein [Geomonas sp.]
MALINQAKREINAKIVFFGPGQAGKATNLKLIYNKLKPDFRGALKAMNVQDARMMFFDFTPPGDGNVEGFKVRFHVYTVSGNKVDQAAWKMVLKGADGIVFVADSDPQRQDSNRESLEKLIEYLKGYGQSLASIPAVFQYNKCDLPDCQAPADMEALLNPLRLPGYQASSQSGEGVLQTLLALVKMVLNGLRSKGVQGLATPDTLLGMVEPAALPAAATPERRSPEQAPAPPLATQPAPQAAPSAQQQEVSFEEAPSEAEGRIEFPPAAEAGLSEGGAVPTAPAMAATGQSSQEELSLEVAGDPQPDGPGRFRMPLTIRSGSRSKSVTLSIAVSLEEE